MNDGSFILQQHSTQFIVSDSHRVSTGAYIGVLRLFAPCRACIFGKQPPLSLNWKAKEDHANRFRWRTALCASPLCAFYSAWSQVAKASIHDRLSRDHEVEASCNPRSRLSNPHGLRDELAAIKVAQDTPAVLTLKAAVD